MRGRRGQDGRDPLARSKFLTLDCAAFLFCRDDSQVLTAKTPPTALAARPHPSPSHYKAFLSLGFYYCALLSPPLTWALCFPRGALAMPHLRGGSQNAQARRMGKSQGDCPPPRRWAVGPARSVGSLGPLPHSAHLVQPGPAVPRPLAPRTQPCVPLHPQPPRTGVSAPPAPPAHTSPPAPRPPHTGLPLPAAPAHLGPHDPAPRPCTPLPTGPPSWDPRVRVPPRQHLGALGRSLPKGSVPIS